MIGVRVYSAGRRGESRRADARGVHVHRDGLWGPIRRVWRVSRKTLNLGILAHVDAGKTTLTERLLFASGVIDRPGSVDAGTTVTDSLPLQRRPGIPTKSAVASFPVRDVDVNLLDTPANPHFIPQGVRGLSALGGVALVISAVES